VQKTIIGHYGTDNRRELEVGRCEVIYDVIGLSIGFSLLLINSEKLVIIYYVIMIWSFASD